MCDARTTARSRNSIAPAYRPSHAPFPWSLNPQIPAQTNGLGRLLHQEIDHFAASAPPVERLGHGRLKVIEIERFLQHDRA
jgi:hypothetical protein